MQRFRQRLFAAFLPLGLILVAVGTIAYRALREVETADANIEASTVVLRAIRAAQIQAVSVEANQRSYLLTDAPVYYRRFESAIDSLHGYADSIGALAAERFPDDARYPRYRFLLLERLRLANATVDTNLKKGKPAALRVIRTNRGMAIMDSLRTLAATLEQELNTAVASYRTRAADQTSTSLFALVAGSSLSVILLGAAFVLLTGFERRRAQAEALLQASEAFARGIIDTAPDVIVRLTADGIVQSLNPAFTAITGWPASDWVGNAFAGIVNGHDPSAFQARLAEASAGRGSDAFQLNFKRLNGGIVLGECTLTPQRHDGAVECVIGIIRDRTGQIQASAALRESEERLRRVVGSVPISLWAIDTLGIVTLLEGKGLSLFGLQPGELVGQLAFDYIAKDEKVRAAIRRALGGEDVIDNTMIGERSFEVRYSPIRTEGGPVQGVLVIALDVTERLLAEKERERLIAELQDALASVKTLSGLIPIYSSCKKIRDDSGYWNHLESYIAEHSEAQFSHGICPDCAAKLYPGFYKPKQS